MKFQWHQIERQIVWANSRGGVKAMQATQAGRKLLNQAVNMYPKREQSRFLEDYVQRVSFRLSNTHRWAHIR